VQIDRKFKDPVANLKLTCKITIASNEFLEVPDHSLAMLRRLNIVQFNKLFAGTELEDSTLDRKLSEEIPGIAVWALAGLQRLRKNNQFTLPKSSKRALAEWRTSTSPIAAFLEECTEIDPDAEVSKTELYDSWTGWSRERGMRTLSKSKFFERLRANAPHAQSTTYEQGVHKVSVFKGMKLMRWAQRQYTGRPE
jgi:putative DNA primase/helicase